MDAPERRLDRGRCCGCGCYPHADVYMWVGVILLFVAFVLQPIALGTRAWSTSHMKYCAGTYCSSPVYTSVGVGLFSLVVNNNPFVVPLASATHMYRDCGAWSVNDFAVNRWGCSELQQSGAATFALGLVSLVIDAVLVVFAWVELRQPESSRERAHGATLARALLSAAAALSALLQFVAFVVWRARAHTSLEPLLTWWAWGTKADEWVYYPGYSHTLAVTAFVLLVAAALALGFSACNVRGTARETHRARAYRVAQPKPPPPAAGAGPGGPTTTQVHLGSPPPNGAAGLAGAGSFTVPPAGSFRFGSGDPEALNMPRPVLQEPPVSVYLPTAPISPPSPPPPQPPPQPYEYGAGWEQGHESAQWEPAWQQQQPPAQVDYEPSWEVSAPPPAPPPPPPPPPPQYGPPSARFSVF